jgi:L-asparaginase
MVMQGKYETSRSLMELGVISGGDMTLEAAVTKVMVLLGNYSVDETKQRLSISLAGELSEG